MPTSPSPPVPRTQAGFAPRSSAHLRISSGSVSILVLAISVLLDLQNGMRAMQGELTFWPHASRRSNKQVRSRSGGLAGLNLPPIEQGNDNHAPDNIAQRGEQQPVKVRCHRKHAGEHGTPDLAAAGAAVIHRLADVAADEH